MSEQRQRFLEDYQLNYYSITELAERFSISRKTAHKWINRFKRHGKSGFHEHSRRPHSCPWQTDAAITAELVALRKRHPNWGPKKLLDQAASRSEAASSIDINCCTDPGERRVGEAQASLPARPSWISIPQGPNDIWAADEFRLKNGEYCFPLTVSDLSSRFLLGVDAHPAISMEKTFRYFTTVFHTYGLPNRIRTDNGTPFASNALARLSQLSVWFIKLGIYPELIEPGEPQYSREDASYPQTRGYDPTGQQHGSPAEKV